jgi:hypothetical protein
VNAVGGVWDTEAMTFTVTSPVASAVGQQASLDLATKQRLDPGTNLEMQFCATSESTSVGVMATESTGQWLDDLRVALPDGQQYLRAYDFEVTGIPESERVLVSMQIAAGLAAEDLEIWHGDDASGWELFVPTDLVVDDGWASFSVESFSSYALSTDGLNAGDANKDGVVNVGDLGILSTYYGLEEGATWDMGDFNGDGMINVGDLGILSTYYGTDLELLESSLSLMSESTYAIADVPEPATMSLLALGGIALLRRRRNRG